MNLKSFGFATNIPCLRPNYTFPEYCRARGLEDFEPISFTTFCEYGEWFQQQLVPDVETTPRITHRPAGRRLRGDLNPVRLLHGATRHCRSGPELLHAHRPTCSRRCPRDFVTPRFRHIEIRRERSVCRTRYRGRSGPVRQRSRRPRCSMRGGARVQILARRDRVVERPVLRALAARRSC